MLQVSFRIFAAETLERPFFNYLQQLFVFAVITQIRVIWVGWLRSCSTLQT